jgi:hypothetical protein
MERIVFKKSFNDQGLISKLELGGMLVLENSVHLKDELVTASKNLNIKVKIEVKDIDEIDISCIQIILAFIKFMDDHHVSYTFEWSLSDDHYLLLENVGFSNELFLN